MTAPNKEPLWELLDGLGVYAGVTRPLRQKLFRVLIRALIEWLVPEQEEPEHIVQVSPDTGQYSTHEWDEWCVKQKLRQQLLNEITYVEVN